LKDKIKSKSFNLTKTVHVIGGGLYGCLTAWQIKKNFPAMRVKIVDSTNCLLSAFNAIEMGGQFFNNGFHGIELPRANDLWNFLTCELDIDLKITENIRKLLICGEVVNYVDSLKSYPLTISKYFESDIGLTSENYSDFYNLVSDEYQKILEIVSQRYSDSYDNVEHLLVPWYFPSDFILDSQDEGAVFRNAVRSSIVCPEYAVPNSGLFMDLQKPFKRAMEAIGVELHLDTMVEITREEISYSSQSCCVKVGKSDSDIVFFCSPPVSILKTLNPDIFSSLTKDPRNLVNAIAECRWLEHSPNFTEILCCDDAFPSLARISKPKSYPDMHMDIIQLELFERGVDDLLVLNSSLNNYLNCLASKLGYNNVSIVDSVQTRAVYFPNKVDIDIAINEVGLWAGKFQSVYFLGAFGPINMTKAWLYSEDNIKKINLVGERCEPG
jgi:hypothetical protein